jgi:hypothetical protein
MMNIMSETIRTRIIRRVITALYTYDITDQSRVIYLIEI